MRAALAVVFLLLPSVALAQPAASPATKWTVTARSAFAYLGPRERPTGGLLVGVDVSRGWSFGESSHVSLGVGLSSFGFDSGGRWAAILGGPVAAIWTRSYGPVYAGLAFHLDAGRIPTCNQWGLCLLYSGLFPAGAATVSYAPSERVSLDLTGGTRVVNTLGWSGAAAEAGLNGIVRF